MRLSQSHSCWLPNKPETLQRFRGTKRLRNGRCGEMPARVHRFLQRVLKRPDMALLNQSQASFGSQPWYGG